MGVNEGKTYHIETMGCQMNERDSETLAGMLEVMGYRQLAEARGFASGASVGSRPVPVSDVCAVSTDADARVASVGAGAVSTDAGGCAASVGVGADARGLKAAWSGADVIVINTCSVRENADNRFFGLLGQVKKEKEANPHAVVAVCGCMMQQPHVIDRIKSKYGWVDIVFGTHNIHTFPHLLAGAIDRHEKIVSISDVGGEIVEGLPSVRKRPFNAFVNITYGCDNFCTYCIVPYTRGRERSRDPF
ncbi:MAG: hypothetical protein LBO81_01120, partial [Clostridiales Family XIII bacterium]|nr:hypothetical protein [Clostridiales Family XIII bacterium]